MKHLHRRQANPYQKASIETASPGQIVLMLYDGALRFLSQAKEGFELDSPIQRNEVVNNNIVRVLNIVAELRDSLDHKVDSEIPKTLDDLYNFVYHHLTQANIKKDPVHLPDCERVLKNLRDSWAEMLLNQDKDKPKIKSLSQSA